MEKTPRRFNWGSHRRESNPLRGSPAALQNLQRNSVRSIFINPEFAHQRANARAVTTVRGPPLIDGGRRARRRPKAA
jgi:hypothetical protein